MSLDCRLTHWPMLSDTILENMDFYESSSFYRLLRKARIGYDQNVWVRSPIVKKHQCRSSMQTLFISSSLTALLWIPNLGIAISYIDQTCRMMPDKVQHVLHTWKKLMDFLIFADAATPLPHAMLILASHERQIITTWTRRGGDWGKLLTSFQKT